MASTDNTPSSGALFLVVTIVVFGLLVLTGGDIDFASTVSPSEKQASDRSLRNSSNSSNSFINAPDKTPLVYSTTSPWAGKVTLSRGNAASERQSYKEYVTINLRSGSKEAVNITGWSLTNNRGGKVYQLGDQTIRVDSQRVYIPQGAKLLLPTDTSPIHDVILNPGEKAIVTTGNPPNAGGTYGRTSFQTNICTGYIEELDEYRFTPSLRRSCPDPEDYPGVNELDEACYQFVRRLSRCHTPEFQEFVVVRGELDRGYVDNVGGLSAQCKLFIQTHYNYQSCVAFNLGRDNFYEKEWRIFLRQPFELWGRNREVISLYDRNGKLVDEISY